MCNLSIIVPHYNSPLKLKRLLDSIPNISDIQVIVVDDRSTKELGLFDEVIKGYSNKNISFFSNDRKNKGAGTCRNIGLEKAQGKWLLFADADDYFLDNFHLFVLEFFESSYDIVFFKPTSWDENYNEISNRHKGYSKIIEAYFESNNDLNLRYKFGVPWSKLFNHNFVKINKISFDEIIASNDVMFSVKTGFYAEKIQVSKKYIYCVTKSKYTLTQNISLNIFRTRLEVFIKMIDFLRLNLSTKDFKSLNFYGSDYLIKTLKYKLGFKELLKTYKILRNHKIKILDLKLLNPLFIVKKIIKHLKHHDTDKYYR